jgi:hypothetical protein
LANIHHGYGLLARPWQQISGHLENEIEGQTRVPLTYWATSGGYVELSCPYLSLFSVAKTDYMIYEEKS